MIYIKMDSDSSLIITKNEPIYRGENLCKKITYLIPLAVGEINPENSFVYLCYIRADGVADIVLLNRSEEKYNESYYQYTLPVNCKLSKYPGEVCTWIQLFSGPPSSPTIAKSGECILQIMESKNIGDFLCDHQLTAIYEMQKAVSEKADNIVFDPEGKTLQLSSQGVLIGDAIDTSDIASSGDDVIHFDDAPSDPDNTDDVIYFG